MNITKAELNHIYRQPAGNNGHNENSPLPETLSPEQMRHMLYELRQSEAKYRAMIEAFDGYMYICSRDFRIEFMNNKLIQRTGRDATGDKCHMILHGLDTPCNWCVNNRVFSGESARWEIRSPKDDRWYEVNNSPIYNSNGTISKQAMITDITERKLADEKLSNSEESQKTILHAATSGFWLTDTKGGLLEVNDAYCRMSGYSKQELLSLSILDIESKETADEAAAHMRRVMEHGADRFESQHRRKDGTTFDVEINVQYRSTYGGQLVIFLQDITERKRSEEALRSSEEKLSAIYNLSPDSININGLDDSVFLSVNQGFTAMLGYSAEELIGYPASHMGIWINHEDRPHLARQLKEHGSVNNHETRLRRKDGIILTVLISSRLIEIEGKTCTLNITRDITDRKQAEESRYHFERQLLQSQKLESLGIMAGGIAHDFNNLLQAILGNIELASRELATDSGPHRHIAKAMVSGRRAADLTNLMLTYIGKGSVEKHQLNLNDLVRENCEILKIAVSATVTMAIALSTEIPAIMADKAQILQVIMNLITNAAESYQERPGIINIATSTQNFDQAFLAESLQDVKPEPGRFVVLEVGDNGCGMSNEILARLFDPFFTTKFAGRGMGMSAVLGIIKAHCGAMFVESEPDKGTTFTILLPAAESAPVKVNGPVTLPVISGTLQARPLAGMALVVDDERSVLKICAKMVELCGFTVIIARDGIEAVARFREHADAIDVVLMDLTMPNMDGIEAMNAICAIKPETRVILASGFNRDELDYRFSGQIPSGFIRKPYSMRVLEAELRSVLQAGPCATQRQPEDNKTLVV